MVNYCIFIKLQTSFKNISAGFRHGADVPKTQSGIRHGSGTGKE